MIFTGLHNQTVLFEIAGYQFPDIPYDEWDSNWLMIHLNVTSSLGSWEVTDPSMLTWEIKSLARWFKDISEDPVRVDPQKVFTEPNISFELLPGITSPRHFRIHFNLESKPVNAKKDTGYFVECPGDAETLKRYSDELMEELSRFPRR